MQSLSTEVNSEWLSYETAASQLGMTRQNLGRLLNLRPELKAKYVRKEKRLGDRKFIYYVERNGILALLALKDADRGNKNKSAPGVQMSDRMKGLAVSKIAEGQSLKAADQMGQFILQQMAAMQETNRIMLEEIRAIRAERQLQAPSQSQLPAAELQELKELKGRVEEYFEPDRKLTDSQRKYLNERVRALAYQVKVPYGVVWGKVHDYTGKRPVDEYCMDDYETAIKFLKKQYLNNGLTW